MGEMSVAVCRVVSPDFLFTPDAFYKFSKKYWGKKWEEL